MVAIVLDAAGRVCWVNGECEQLTGYRLPELLGQPLRGAPLAAGNGEDFVDAVARSRAGGPPLAHESRWISRGGDQLRIVWSLSTLRDEHDVVRYVIGSGVNISRRRSIAQADELEEMRLNSLLDISQKATHLSEREIILHTLEEVVRLTRSRIGYLHFVNPDQDTLQLYAWSQDTLRDCTAEYQSHYPISQAGVWADCARLKKPVVHNDYQHLPNKQGYPEGHTHLLRHVSIPIMDGDQVVIILGVGNKPIDYDENDVRQMLLAADSLWKIILRKRAEEELRQHVQALQEADRQKNKFLAILAHELRNPLAPISSALQILERDEASAELSREARNVISRQLKHITFLVDDLLDVSRITRGRIQLKREPVDLVQIVENAVEVHRGMLDARAHQLDVFHTEPALLVHGDPIRLAQVVGNLLHNAVKYTPPGGQISVHIGQTGEQIELRVNDSGVGISPSMLPRVFDLFAQADESLDRAQGGLGLGLTLVRQLVELHGGQVEARSEGLERGSEFVVRLPRCPASQREASRPVRVAAAPPPVRSSDRSATDGQRILLVEDNRDSATMLAGLLESLGHLVQTTHDGHAALSAVDAFRPQVVLLDIGLPEMNGYEVARRIRQRRDGPGPLLVALTGYAHPQAIDQARRAGFDHHLVKPLDLDKLCRLLSEHARGGGARRPR